jgi:hypothetical protein
MTHLSEAAIKYLDINVDVSNIHQDRITSPEQNIRINGASGANTASPAFPNQMLDGSGRKERRNDPNRRRGKTILL